MLSFPIAGIKIVNSIILREIELDERGYPGEWCPVRGQATGGLNSG